MVADEYGPDDSDEDVITDYLGAGGPCGMAVRGGLGLAGALAAAAPTAHPSALGGLGMAGPGGGPMGGPLGPLGGPAPGLVPIISVTPHSPGLQGLQGLQGKHYPVLGMSHHSSGATIRYCFWEYTLTNLNFLYSFLNRGQLTAFT